MTVNDPISDMLTRIRNGLMAGHSSVAMPSSRLKESVARIFKDEGYITEYSVAADEPFPVLRIDLKYAGERRSRRPVISGIERVSSPGRRVYVGHDAIPRVRSGMGIVVMTTPKGVMTGRQARREGMGGEVMCKVW